MDPLSSSGSSAPSAPVEENCWDVCDTCAWVCCSACLLVSVGLAIAAICVAVALAPSSCPLAASYIFNGEQSLCDLSRLSGNTAKVNIDSNRKNAVTSYLFDHMPDVLNESRKVNYHYKFKVKSDQYEYLELSLPKGSQVKFSGEAKRKIDWYIGPNYGGYSSVISRAYAFCMDTYSCSIKSYVAQSSGTHWILLDNYGYFSSSGTMDVEVDYLRYDTSDSIDNCTGKSKCVFDFQNKHSSYLISELNDPTIPVDAKDYRVRITDGGDTVPGLIVGMCCIGCFVLSVLLCICGMSECAKDKADEIRAANKPAVSPSTATPAETTTTPAETTATAENTPSGDVEVEFAPSSAAPPTYTEAPAPTDSFSTAFGSEPMTQPPAPYPESTDPVAQPPAPYPESTDPAAQPAGSYSVDPNASDDPAPNELS